MRFSLLDRACDTGSSAGKRTDAAAKRDETNANGRFPVGTVARQYRRMKKRGKILVASAVDLLQASPLVFAVDGTLATR